MDRNHDTPSLVAKFSIALGVIEHAIALEKESEWSFEPGSVDELYSGLVGPFIQELHHGLCKLHPCSGPEGSDAGKNEQDDDGTETENARRKVKYIADEIWARLNCSAVKNITHAQHVYNFVRYLDDKNTVKRRVLDCAGVVTCTYCFCQILASDYGHKDLEGVRMCITEDHCFLTLHPDRQLNAVCREHTVEVTADNKEKRGLTADERLWNSWLYAGGHPVVCETNVQVLVACTVSIDYAITKSTASEELFDIQLTLLRFFYQHEKESMYPAAISKLATLEEEAAWDTMVEDSSIAAGHHHVQRMLNLHHQWYQSWSTTVSSIHQAAVDACEASTCTDNGWHWYPYSSMATFYFYQNEFYVYLMSSMPELDSNTASRVLESLEHAIKTCCSGSNVLAKYIHQTNDEELYKDIEDIIGKMHEAMKMTANVLINNRCSPSGPDNSQNNVVIFSAELLKAVLQFWDNVCSFFTGKSKPVKWIKQMIQVSMHFDSESRSQAVQSATFTSWCMQAAAPHLTDLKPRALLPLFEAADPGPVLTKRRSTIPSSRDSNSRQVRHRA